MLCKNILVVEDDEAIRDALQTTLELEGYRVVTAANGKTGLEMLATIASPCLVLLDLMMPVMDGWAFAEAVRQDIVLAAIPIVVVSAYTGAKQQSVANAREIIKKPVDLDVLLDVVKQYCTAETTRP